MSWWLGQFHFRSWGDGMEWVRKKLKYIFKYLGRWHVKFFQWGWLFFHFPLSISNGIAPTLHLIRIFFHKHCEHVSGFEVIGDNKRILFFYLEHSAWCLGSLCMSLLAYYERRWRYLSAWVMLPDIIAFVIFLLWVLYILCSVLHALLNLNISNNKNCRYLEIFHRMHFSTLSSSSFGKVSFVIRNLQLLMLNKT